MKREHTVINGAGRMEKCVHYLKEAFVGEGYRVEVDEHMNRDEASCCDVLIGSRNFIRKIPGASVCVKVRLVVGERDKIAYDIVDIDDDLWHRFGGPAISLKDFWMVHPIGATCAILTKAHRQRKLRKLVHDVITLFLASA